MAIRRVVRITRPLVRLDGESFPGDVIELEVQRSEGRFEFWQLFIHLARRDVGNRLEAALKKSSLDENNPLSLYAEGVSRQITGSVVVRRMVGPIVHLEGSGVVEISTPDQGHVLPERRCRIGATP